MTKKEEIIKELARKYYLTDEEFERHKDFLKDECDPNINGNIERMCKPFLKTAFEEYCGKKVQTLVCMTKTLLENEVWKKHPNSEYNIEVSNFGRVRRIFKETDITPFVSEEYRAYIDGSEDLKIVLQKNFAFCGEFWAPMSLSPTMRFEASNLGQRRVYEKYQIFPQFENNDTNDGYLKVNISNKKADFVYNLVAETFKPVEELAKTNYEGYQVHHINNNGYENTPENLIWLSESQHGVVHEYH